MANETSEKSSAPKASRTGDLGAAQVQAKIEREQAQGYRGVVADPTPNSAYSIAGVTGGEPTPETDDAAADAAHARRRELGRRMEPTGRGETR